MSHGHFPDFVAEASMSATAQGFAMHDRYTRCGELGGFQVKAGVVAYRQGMPKLSPALQTAMLREYAAGEPVADLALKYGVDRTYPGQLAARRGLPLRRPRRK